MDTNKINITFTDNGRSCCLTDALDVSSAVGGSQEVQTNQGQSSYTQNEEAQAQQLGQSQDIDTASISGMRTEDEERLLESSDESTMHQLDKLTIKEPRLKKAQRKRYRWLRNHGHTHEEASVKCKMTIAEREGRPPPPTTKRVRSEDSNPDNAATTKKAKVQEPSTSKGGTDKKPQKPSYSGALGGVKVGIVPANYPRDVLTTAQQTDLEDRLARLVLLCKENGPRFRGVTFRPGHVVVNCENQISADWVKSQEGELQLPEISIKVLDEKEIPSPHIITGFFPNSLHYNLDEVKSFIRIQNGLPVDQWKCLKTAETGRNCVEVVFSIDHASYEMLKAVDFVISYRLGTVKLHLKKEKSTAKVTAPPTPMECTPAAKTATATETAKPQKSSNDKPTSSHNPRSTPTPSTSGNRREKSGRSKDGTRGPLLRQERVILPSSRNRGKPWKHQKESRNERH